MREHFVECGIEAANEPGRRVRDRDEDAVDDLRRAVSQILRCKALPLAAAAVRRERENERRVDRLAERAGLFVVDAHQARAPAAVEIALEEMAEDERGERTAKGSDR